MASNRGLSSQKIGEWDHNAIWDLGGDSTFTMLVAMEFADSTGNGGSWLSHRTDSSTGAGYWAWSEGSGTNANMKFEFQHSSGIANQEWTGAFPAVGYNAWMLTRKAGGTYEMWVNGASQGTKTGATQDLLTGGSHEMNISSAGSQYFRGDYYIVAILKDIALDDAHAKAFYNDPFGLVRPHVAPYPFPWQREGFAGAASFVPYPNPRYSMSGGMQNQGGGVS